MNSVLRSIPPRTHLPRKMSHLGVLLFGTRFSPFLRLVHRGPLGLCDRFLVGVPVSRTELGEQIIHQLVII